MSPLHTLSEDDSSLFRRNISLLEEQITRHLPTSLLSSDILNAIRKVPRHLFVDSAYRYMAYTDNALPTQRGQTTSAPSVIAEMICLAGVKQGDSILEIGTGTGYEAAILYEMGLQVHTIEIDPRLAASARDLFFRMGYSINSYEGNGIRGLKDHAHYKGIIIAASIPSLARSTPLLEQLNPAGGRLVVPVGSRYNQLLTVIERKYSRCATWVIEETPVTFVPLVSSLSS